MSGVEKLGLAPKTVLFYCTLLDFPQLYFLPEIRVCSSSTTWAEFSQHRDDGRTVLNSGHSAPGPDLVLFERDPRKEGKKNSRVPLVAQVWTLCRALWVSRPT